LAATCALAACSIEPRPGTNQLLSSGFAFPVGGQSEVIQRRRGAVEFFVKDNHPRIVSDIAMGGGAYLDEAIALAKVSSGSRDALKIDLRGDHQIYASSPDALVIALMRNGS